jgi:hypothetical protein
MKKIAITFSLFLFVGIGMSFGQCKKSNDILAGNKGCCSKTEAAKCQPAQKVADTEVMLYYFHATRRCATCESVERVSKETLDKNFKGKVAFKSFNREDRVNKKLVEQYKISGQTLLLIKGDEVKDLTTKAFLYAKNDPEKLEKEITTQIEELLK